MDYQKKYLKYKNKYFKIKQLGGNKLTKSEFNENEHDGYCPDDKPYMCDMDTKAYGLCKSSPTKCDINDSDGVIPTIPDDTDEGKRFGYKSDFLHLPCDTLEEFETKPIVNSTKQNVPNEFKIMTCNLWGILRKIDDTDKYNFLKFVMETRMIHIAKNIIDLEPDIVCFQEMSQTTYDLLSKFLKKYYPYMYEIDPNYDTLLTTRKRDIETCVFSKYQAKNYTNYNVGGNLGYTNSLLVVEYPNLSIYNCYLQAGSKVSVGQSKKWKHYSRCRRDQFMNIRRLIESDTRPVVVVGDFNCHLDGMNDGFPELKVWDNFLKDSYRATHINKDEEDYDGLTENTDINHMRWNNKFAEKKLRYDGILYRGEIQPIVSDVVCKQQIPLNEEQSRLFEKYMVTDPEANKEKIRYYDDTKKLFALNMSDHFPVITKFIM